MSNKRSGINEKQAHILARQLANQNGKLYLVIYDPSDPDSTTPEYSYCVADLRTYETYYGGEGVVAEYEAAR